MANFDIGSVSPETQAYVESKLQQVEDDFNRQLTEGKQPYELIGVIADDLVKSGEQAGVVPRELLALHIEKMYMAAASEPAVQRVMQMLLATEENTLPVAIFVRGEIGAAVVKFESRSAARRGSPNFREQPDGSFWVNAAGTARLIYESDPRDSGCPEKRRQIKAFKRRVNGYIAAQRIATGKTIDIEDALAALVPYDKMEDLMRRGDTDGAIDLILAPKPQA